MRGLTPQGMVIQGLDRGIDGMCVGEERRLTIPHELGFGRHVRAACVVLMFQGVLDKLAPNSTVVYTVTLLKVSNKEA